MKITTTKQLDTLEYWEYVNTLHGADAYAICSSLQRFFNFLKTELKPNHFIPAKKVDGKWVVLEKPKEEDYNTGNLETDYNNFANEFNEYKKAEQEVLFKGFRSFSESNKWVCIETQIEGRILIFNYSLEDEVFLSSQKEPGVFKTIQDLIPLDLELTQNAIERL